MASRRRSRSYYHKVLEDLIREYHDMIDRYRLEVDNLVRVAIKVKMGTMNKKISKKFTVSVAKPEPEKSATKKGSKIKYFSRTYYQQAIEEMQNLIQEAEKVFSRQLNDLFRLINTHDLPLDILKELREVGWHFFDTTGYLDNLD